MTKWLLTAAIGVLPLAAAAGSAPAPVPASASSPAPAVAALPAQAPVTRRRLEHPDAEPGNWLAPGRTPGEQRFSPLKLIDEHNAARLGLKWYADLDTYRGVDATPLEIDGVLYNISAFDITSAYDAVSGKLLWRFDPQVPVSWAGKACCGPVSRGLAAWQNHIIIATLDGRLMALDRATGKPAWSTQTFEPGQPLTITGAPRIAGSLIIIGNGGGDLGARGYISAYHADSGRLAWRFYIVPGNPAKMPEGAASDPVMPMAAKTWTGQWWRQGGGGNDWDTIVYDPELKLVYFGTGNGSPHPQAFRSPGGGDNLFLSSIVAVDAATGHYVWHYQEVPGDEWDYDSTSPLMLADLNIGGQMRKVIMHAPKDGFFYVLDRATGKVLSARNYVPNTWASGIDLATGRPRINPSAHLTVKPHLVMPGTGGGHNWNPMSYSPLTGLAYIPAQEQWWDSSRLPDGQFKFTLGEATFGGGVGNFPQLRRKLEAEVDAHEKGYLLAWDPVHQREAFRINYPHPGSGGTLVTAGNLLIQGTINKTLAVYRATDGHKLWEMPVESVPVGGPITYAVGGRQYIAVNAGWNSAIVRMLDRPAPFSVAPARLLVFALDARGVALPPAPPSVAVPPPPAQPQPQAQVLEGAQLYSRLCSTCHGANAIGGVKDLRHLDAATHARFAAIVLGGERSTKGMPTFRGRLSDAQAQAIHAYLIDRAQQDWQPSFVPPHQQ